MVVWYGSSLKDINVSTTFHGLCWHFSSDNIKVTYSDTYIKSSLSQARIQRLIRAAEHCHTSTTMHLQVTKSLNDGFLEKTQAMKNHDSIRLEKTVFISCRLLCDYIAILIILLNKKRFTIIILVVIKKKPDTVYTFIMVILIHQQVMEPFRWFRRKMWFCFI